MRKATTLLLPVLLGTFLFNFLFWQEKMGLNTLLFGVGYVATLWFIFPDSRTSRLFWLTASGTLLTGAMITWHNSSAAKFAYIISVITAAGFAQEPALRQIFYSALHYLAGWWQTPRHFQEALNTSMGSNRKNRKSIGKTIGLSITPLLVVAVFYVLYYAANDKFAGIADQFWGQVARILSFDISWKHLFFVLFGFFLTGAAFWRNQTKLAADELASSDQLHRERPPRNRYIESLRMLDLKKAYQQSLILLWMLNALLLVVNLTDVRYVWFGFDEDAILNLKSYVHEGTYYLIASILLAIGVLLYIFRKNLHFFPNNKPLRFAATVWLAQNAILAISVAVRTTRYIDYHGLAYKRIGVFLFLLLVFYGLYTLMVKIREMKTIAWIWRRNSLAVYLLILFNACIGWDAFITRYNLSGAPKGAIDVRFMIYTMSDKNIYLLEDNISLLPKLNMYPQMTEGEIQESIIRKRAFFEEKMETYTWKSWNWGELANE